LIMTLIVIGTSYIFRCNFNYALASPFDDNVHPFNDNWNYVDPLYIFFIWVPIIFVLFTGTFALNVLISERVNKNRKLTK
jgi:hypothetical protein